MQVFDMRRPASDALVVIVGGSGFIGRYLVQELARTDVRIRIVVRNAVAALFLKPLGKLGQIDIDRKSQRRCDEPGVAGAGVS